MVLSRLLRAGEHKTVRRLRAIADHINGLEADVAGLSDDELRAKTDEFRSRYGKGESLDDLLPEAFSVVREAAKRTLGQRHFDVQLMGGAAMHLGNIAEMRTGEGKTLTCVLPAYLNAIAGEGVHVVTVNDYLAKRDAEWMGRVHRLLGLDVGVILSQMTPDERRIAYHADVTYGTNNEFGFDYLRDNMASALAECVQRGHSYAIVDEVDSILIDEARTPLIISGPADQSSRWYGEFARLAPMLKRDVHYDVDDRKRTVGISEMGVALVEDQLGIENLYEAANTPLIGYLNNALKAKELYAKDKDYIVRDGEVLIVDEFTGRLLQGRRYNEGMHQAIEAKEKVEIKAENQTLATITLQNYFRLYEKLAGMTGTAQTEAAELVQIYKLGVVPIPTNMPMIRADHGDLIYKSEKAKFNAVVEDIAQRHAKGQPVLVGTVSVGKSEFLSKELTRKGIAHEVINAKEHEREAEIIAQAGQVGAVTIATNMAGRGVDIVLGGGDPSLGIDPAEKLADRLANEAAMESVKKKVNQIALEQAERIAGESANDECGEAERAAMESARVAYERAEPFRRSGRPLEELELRLNQARNEKIDVLCDLVGSKIESAMAGLGHPEDLRIKVRDSSLDRMKVAVLKESEKTVSSRQRRKDDQRETTSIIHDAVYSSAYEAIFDKLVSERERDEAVYDEVYPRELGRANKSREQVCELGGLYVLGTERHDSRRIDNQLRGRSGRQGDPGESRFYLSLRDELMVRFNGPLVESIMTRLRMEEDVPIEAKMVSRAIQSAQTQVEQQNFEIRKNVLKYDEVMDLQRKVIYAERRRVLEGEDLREQVEHMMTDVLTAYVNGATQNGYAEDWDLDQLWTALKTLYPVGIKYEDIADDVGDLTRDALLSAVVDDALAAYRRRDAELAALAGPDAMRQLERQVVLAVLDRKWREHLYEMDYLKEGIGLRAMAQRDPLVEYKREGFEMFSALLEALKEESVGFLFNVQVQVAQPEVAPDPVPTQLPVTPAAAGSALAQIDGQAAEGVRPTPAVSPAPAALASLGGVAAPPSRPLTYSGPAEDGGTEVRGGDHRGSDAGHGAGEPSRNAPCHCGSGKKYKRCHGAPTTAHS